MERVAITGATGFVGRYVVNELVNRRYQVYALVRNAKKLREVSPRVLMPLRWIFPTRIL